MPEQFDTLTQWAWYGLGGLIAVMLVLFAAFALMSRR